MALGTMEINLGTMGGTIVPIVPKKQHAGGDAASNEFHDRSSVDRDDVLYFAISAMEQLTGHTATRSGIRERFPRPRGK